MWWMLENKSYLIVWMWKKEYIYMYVVWGSTDQAQFWRLLCQTLKHA